MSKSYSLQQRTGLATVFLIALLALFSIGISFAVTTYGFTSGFIILTGIIGFAVMIVCFAKPTLGFYVSISLGFIVSVFERLLNGAIPLDYVVEVLVYATLFGQVYKKRLQGEAFWKGMRHPINYFMLIYLGYLLLECFNPNANSLLGSLFSVRKTAEIVALYITALSLFQSYKTIRQFFHFWIIVSGLCGLYACYQQLAGFPAFELNWIYASETRVAIYRLDNGSFRKFSTLTDPAAFGILMAVSALVTLVVLLKARLKRSYLLFSAALLFQLLGMSYSGTRTAVFTLIAGICLYILLTINNVRTMLFAVFCLLAFGFIMLAPIYGNITINRFRSAFHFTKDASYNVRNDNRAKIQPYIYAHPVGGGPMTTGTNGLRYNPSHYLSGFPTDSGFLKSALEYGWIGLILVCVLFFVILQQGAHAFFNSEAPLARAFLLAAVAALFGNIVSQYSQIAIGATPQIFLYHALIAVIVNISKLETNENTNV